jgi:predicted nucleic acid-binding protein
MIDSMLASSITSLDAIFNARKSGGMAAAILIAGQALSRGLILVTRNTREFSRVKDLRLEDWESP